MHAELILEVESTMSLMDMARNESIPPFLHLLRPINLENKRGEVAESGEAEGAR